MRLVAAGAVALFVATRTGAATLDVRISGASHGWVAVIPLQGAGDVRTLSLTDVEHVRLESGGPARLLCGGGPDVATVCRALSADDTKPQTFALAAGRHVAGRVVMGREPFARASVRFLPRGIENRRGVAVPWMREETTGKLVDSVRTAADGTFAIGHLAPGAYDVEVAIANGPVTLVRDVRVPPDGTDLVRLPDIPIDDGVHVTVVVRDADGAKLANAGVALLQPAADRSAAPLSIETRTNAEGEVTLRGIDAQRKISVTCIAADHARATLRFDVPPSFVPCVLERFASLRGVVRNEDGETIAKAVVSIAGTDRRANADEHGVFVLAQLAPGAVRLRIAAPGSAAEVRELTLASGELRDAGEIRLHRGDALHGTVTDAETSQPVAGATVAIEDAGGASTATDADGAFTLYGDAAALSVDASGYAHQRAEVRSRDAIAIALARPGTLEVQAFDGETGNECVACSIDAGARTATTDAHGIARFDELVPGEYQITRPQVQTRGAVVTVSSGADTVVATVKPRQTTRVQLGARASTIEVTLTPDPGPAWKLTASSPASSAIAARTAGGYTFRKRAGEAYTLVLSQGFRGTRIGNVAADAQGSVQIATPRATVRAVVAPAADVKLVDAGTARLAAWDHSDAAGAATLPFVPAGIYALQVNGRVMRSPIVVASTDIDLGVVTDAK